MFPGLTLAEIIMCAYCIRKKKKKTPKQKLNYIIVLFLIDYSN